MHRFTALLMASVLAAGCTGTSRSDVADVREVIDTHNANIERWYVAGHADSIASVFAEDGWQMPPNAPPLVGRDSVRAFWANATRWGRWEFDLQSRDVITEGSLAVERGKFTLRFTPGSQAPMPAFEDRGNYVVLWRRDTDGEWRIVWDAPVSEMPPAGAPPPVSSPKG